MSGKSDSPEVPLPSQPQNHSQTQNHSQNQPQEKGHPSGQQHSQNFHGKSYRHYNGQNQSPGGQQAGGDQNAPNAQNAQNAPAGQQGQRFQKGNYQKRNYNNQKPGSHNYQHHQHLNLYSGGYAFAPNMYNPYYLPYYQGMVPNMMPGYASQLPLHTHSPLHSYPAAPAATLPAPTKVKITDKEGRQVDLEEKKKSSASSSAAATPVAASAQMAKSQTPEPQPAPDAAAAAEKKKQAAEEFRRKILARAQAAKEKKEKEAAEAAEAEKPKAEPKAEPKEEKPEAKPEAEKPAEKPVEKPAEQPVEKPVEEKPEAAPEAPVAEASTPETPAPTPEKAEPETEKKASPVPVSQPEPKSEPAPAAVNDHNVETNTHEETPAEEAKEPSQEPEKEDDDEDDADDDEEKDTDAGDEEPKETEKVFDLHSFFTRLSTAREIEDPFSYPYPYPLTGVDARWKAGEKKYRYDPQFLLQFRECVTYPIDDAWKEKLESLGVASRRSGPSGGMQRMNSSKFGQMPGRFNGPVPRGMSFDGRQNSRLGSKRRGGSNMGGPRDKLLRNRNQSKRGKDFKDDDKPAEEVKPLVPLANRWVPRLRMKKTEVKTAPDGTVMLDSEEIERKVKSSLNKLTLEMFEPITNDLLEIAKQSRWEEDAATIRQVISLTFAKACDEPYWSSVYAQFCAKMLKEITDDVKDVNTITKSGEPATGGDLARRILLATCQSEYEKGWVDKLPTNPDGSPLEPEMMSDEYYAMAAAKRRGLGLVKFIGNLYILNMLNDQVILHCLRDQSKNVTDPSEDSLENLAQLIKTVGPRFEVSDRNKAALNMIFDNVQLILDNCKLSLRIRFMLMDLQDLRKSNWNSLKPESGPKTIKEIHTEAELKRLEESRQQAEKRRNKGYQGGFDSRSNSVRQGSSWGSKKDSRQPTKDNRGFQSVSRSQSNRPTPEKSPRENSKRSESVASNMFAALDGQDHDQQH